MTKPKAIITGASSGIGKELSRVLSENGYEVGLVARRIELLEELQQQLPAKSYVKQIDVSKPDSAIGLFKELITEMNGVDLVVINAGVGFKNPDLLWENEKNTIDVNVSGFVAIATAAFSYFVSRGAGHIVGISSIAAIRGSGGSPCYGASKAFEYNYLEGLRAKAFHLKLPITVTTIQPGYVNTPLVAGQKEMFWVAPADKAAEQLYSAIKHKRNYAYITRRWRLVAWLLKILPDFLYFRFR